MERLMMPVEPSDPVTGPYWPSDHAGVAATVSVQVTASGREMPWAVVNDDPLRPGEQSLFLVGTDRRDTVLVGQMRDGRVWGYVSSLRTRGLHELSADGQVYVHAAADSDYVRLGPRLTRDTVTYAGAGNDRVFGGRGADVVYGGDGRDLLFGNGGADQLFGEDGPDYLFGGTGDDLLSGGDSRDVLFGQAGNDVLIGGLGIDWLFGGPGDDDLEDDGEDRLFA
jgi:Ca2+-binding RTX toxin-like protein